MAYAMAVPGLAVPTGDVICGVRRSVPCLVFTLGSVVLTLFILFLVLGIPPLDPVATALKLKHSGFVFGK